MAGNFTQKKKDLTGFRLIDSQTESSQNAIQFPIKIERPGLYLRKPSDLTMSGSISRHFFIGSKIGLLAFVTMLAIVMWAIVVTQLKTGRYIAGLPIVEARVLDVKPQCEMFRNMGKGKKKIVAVIDCDQRSRLQTHKTVALTDRF